MSRKVYVVRRLSWAPAYEPKGGFCPAGYEDVQPGVPVRVFAGRKAAEAFCREQEAKARQLMPPGRITGFRLPKGPKVLAAGLRRLGLPPFDLDEDQWEEEWLDGDELLRWWEGVAADATPEQRAGVWDLLTDVRFFDVVESRLED